MALSNWDTMAVDLGGNPCGGSFASPQGVTVEFYKNWLYIRDEKAWVEGRSFVKSTVAHVNSGDLSYGDVHIVAVRGPQGGVYAVVTSGYGEKQIGMVGCGVYGFDGDEWVGVTAESKEFLQKFLLSEDQEGFAEFSDKVRAVKLGGALRFNQGDAYVADRLGEDTPASEPGQAEKPILLQALDKPEEQG